MSRTWTAAPILAWAVRALVFIIPIFAAWLVIRFTSTSLYRPEGGIGLVLWIAQAGVVGSATSLLTERGTRHFLPLASLLNMSLVFPDQSPSRFSMALKAGTVRKQKQRLAEVRAKGLSSTENDAAEEAISLVTSLGHHDRLTRGHTERVRAYADLIAQEMGLAEEDRQMLAWGSMLHDIGKISVPPEILNKPGRPNKEEWETLKGHPAAGETMLAPLADWLGEWMGAASEHHERWDGGGYPLGLAGTQISLAGRITAVADAYDVITSRRSYKEPTPAAEARKELVRCSGTQFDPEVVRAFLNISLKRKIHVGPLAWLAELPGVAQTIAAVPQAVATSTVVAGSLTVGAIANPSQPAALPFFETVTPAALEIEEPAVQENPASQTTTISDRSNEPAAVESSTTTTDPSATATTLAPTSQPVTTVPSTTTTSIDTSFTIPTTDRSTTTTQSRRQSNGNENGNGNGNTTTVPPATSSTATAPTTTTTTISTTTTTAIVDGFVVVDDWLNMEKKGKEKVYVLANDNGGATGFDLGSFQIVVEPLHAKKFRVHDDHIHYDADKNYTGSDSLTYRICTVGGACETAMLTITITD